MNDGLGPEGSYFEAREKAQRDARRRKIDVIYPIAIVVLYLILGFALDLWHPGWLVFLTIPLHYMHFESRWEQLTHPVMITLIYLVLGCFFNWWHPGWMVFLLIPLTAGLKR